jgi:hypothetical protein
MELEPLSPNDREYVEIKNYNIKNRKIDDGNI